MLNYDLPPAPQDDAGRETRWFIKKSEYNDATRYLHLEVKVTSKQRFRKESVKWKSLRETLISKYLTETSGFEKAVLDAALDIIKEHNEFRFLPTGEVK